MIDYLLLISRQGKLRLAKWFITATPATKAQITRDLTQQVLSRRPKMCNIIEYKGRKVIYRRYASLFFICAIGEQDNELLTLEIIHRYVEVLDSYFGNVCEMDLIFNFQKAYSILDELIIAGELQDPSKLKITKIIKNLDMYEENEEVRKAIAEAFL